MKFFDMMRLIGSNSKYIKHEEDVLMNLIICLSILLTDQNNFFDCLKEKKNASTKVFIQESLFALQNSLNNPPVSQPKQFKFNLKENIQRF